MKSILRRTAVLCYGVLCYAMFLGVFLYAVGFIGNFSVPTRLDGSLEGSLLNAILVNAMLLTLFAIQHSGMARPSFKNWWTKFIPKPIERSTYVLFSNIAMIILFYFWKPMGGIVWEMNGTIAVTMMYGMFTIGLMIVLYATFLINHFDLFGLRQTWMYFRGMPYQPVKFNIPSLYRYVRHPLYVGWLTVCWSTPTMSFAHLTFATLITGYILMAIKLEERNLVDSLPGYAEYSKTVPMLIPRLAKDSASELAT